MNSASEDLRRCLAVARSAALGAGELLLAHWGKLDRSMARSKSVARDLVTQADLESEALILTRLRREFPSHAIEAEESAPDRASDAPRWFVDPLDGTINFLHGLPTFAVSIGLWHGHAPQVAVVHLPRLDETFTAIAGQGAWLGDQRLCVSGATRLSESLVATGFPYRRGDLEHNNLEALGRFFYEVRDIRRMGSAAMDLAYVAAGRLDAYWEQHLAPHDVAAGGLLVREAGGQVSDAEGGEDWLRGGTIVAAPLPLAAAVRARLGRGTWPAC